MKRRGVTLVDAMAALVAVGTLVSISLQIAASASYERREFQRRLFAEVEAANALERASALKWEEVSPSAPLPIELSAAARETLPQGSLKIDVMALDASDLAPAARKVRVEVGWKDRAGQAAKPVRLTKWLYPPRIQEARR